MTAESDAALPSWKYGGDAKLERRVGVRKAPRSRGSPEIRKRPSSARAPSLPGGDVETLWKEKSLKKGPEWHTLQRPLPSKSAKPRCAASLIAPSSPAFHRSNAALRETALRTKARSARP